MAHTYTILDRTFLILFLQIIEVVAPTVSVTTKISLVIYWLSINFAIYFLFASKLCQ